jgi:hypothetical protein
MGFDVHILAKDEELLLPYAIRHYITFCSRIVLHDLGSVDRTKEIARAAGIEIREWDSSGEFNDLLNKKIKDEAWRGTSSDWAAMVDCDEFLYFPLGAGNTLSAYNAANVAVVKPYGFEMSHPVLPTTAGQIYDEIKMGARDDRWYAKPVLISSKRVETIDFGVGADQCKGTLKGGGAFGNPTNLNIPPTYLLHFHSGIGPIERIARLYDERRAKLAAVNVRNRWGNIDQTGIQHAMDKRAYIAARLERVIP